MHHVLELEHALTKVIGKPDEVAVELTLVDTLDVAEDVTDEVSVLVWVDVPLLL